MDKQYTIELSGPFEVMSSIGQIRKVKSIHIFNEGYGNIDVFVVLASSYDDETLYEDAAVIRQILSRLRSLGYTGPDFGAGAEDLQDCSLIVLEAPEEFETFVSAKGWKNLADDYPDEGKSNHPAPDDEEAAKAIFLALMRRMTDDLI